MSDPIRPDQIRTLHRPHVDMCPQGHPHVMCPCGWMTEDAINGEDIDTVYNLGADHLLSLDPTRIVR